MPFAPKKPCARSGCPELVQSGQRYCQAHEAERQKDVDARRGTSCERGYGTANWKRLRLMVLHRDPVCKDCGREPSSVADHIIPKEKGGQDTMENLQGLCSRCHSKKTATEDGGFGR